ncbi:transposase is4 [Holotrichia oblita]|uniref:Transposase is4 n=1 Tax=Holotrichia oblita TaxID=644536 RepID=A0ACB9SNC9_HOLOL|nr:transposase is4 [Holotrichia oblita]
MYFVNPRLQHAVTQSLRNWIFTLRSFIYVWNKLKNNGFKYISPRCFNQDPVENFFSCVRSHGVRNTNPTCSGFISSTKSLLINNLVSPHSPGSNCDEDDTIGVLSTLKSFFEKRITVEEQATFNIMEISSSTPVQRHATDFTTPYVAGAVAKKILKRLECSECRMKMESGTVLSQNTLIRNRQYKDNKLFHPTSNFTNAFHRLASTLHHILPSLVTNVGIKRQIRQSIDKANYSDIFCGEHPEYAENFIKITFNVIFFYYIRNINCILYGNDVRQKDLHVVTRLAYTKLCKKRAIK